MTQQDATVEIVEKSVEEQIIAGLRYTGKYEDCGQYFGQLFRKVGWGAAGKPFCLYYDCEYKADGAQVEVCVPLKQEKPIEGLDVRVLPGGRCVSLMHKGPYSELKRSYEKIVAYFKEKELTVSKLCPSREIYHKGPGMIFRGNPKNYLTEIQFMIEE
ncbi:MAG: GyrI-like domain-containing protein [Candidatus Hinthialibacter antarcticus]|nr:GyrI-like domain-containing protein [Candidatus Hinthialibacter antarcticus]